MREREPADERRQAAAEARAYLLGAGVVGMNLLASMAGQDAATEDLRPMFLKAGAIFSDAGQEETPGPRLRKA